MQRVQTSCDVTFNENKVIKFKEEEKVVTKKFTFQIRMRRMMERMGIMKTKNMKKTNSKLKENCIQAVVSYSTLEPNKNEAVVQIVRSLNA